MYYSFVCKPAPAGPPGRRRVRPGAVNALFPVPSGPVRSPMSASGTKRTFTLVAIDSAFDPELTRGPWPDLRQPILNLDRRHAQGRPFRVMQVPSD